MTASTRKDFLLYLLIVGYTLLVGYVSIDNPEKAAQLAFLGLLGSVVVDIYLPLCFFVCASLLNIQFEGVYEAGSALYIGLLAISILYKNRNRIKMYSKYIALFLYFCVILLMSTLFGFETMMMSSVTMVYTLLICFAVAFSGNDNKSKFLSFSLFVGGIMVLFIVYAALKNGTAYAMDDTSGRLSFGDNVRTLANAIAFTIYFSIFKIIEAINKGQLLKKSYWFIFAAIGLVILMLTVSRGVIFSVAAAFLYLYLANIRPLNFKKAILMIALVVAGIYFIGTIDFDRDYMTNKITTMTGRDVIWGFYIGKLFEGGLPTILFGFGPGSVKRIAVGTAVADAYAHSLFLDYLFCFGILGFIFIALLVLKIGKRLWINKDVYAIGLYIMSVLMFIPSGSANTPLFYYLFGLCMSRLLQNKSTEDNRAIYAKE